MTLSQAMNKDPWERRYHEALEQLERDQGQWSRIEAALRRLGARLVLAATGRHARLDAVLVEIGARLRDSLGESEIGALLQQLSHVIAHMDDATQVNPAAATASAQPDLTPVTQLFGRLLDRLSLLPELAARAARLRENFEHSDSLAGLAAHAEALAELVNQQRALLQEDRLHVERVLQQVNRQIDDFAQHLVGETERALGAAQDRGRLNAEMHAEMQALDAQVGDARELDTLQHQVRSRLRTIGAHLREFREREESRERSWSERSQRQRERIKELETQTHELMQSLRREQENAATDALTGLANRMSYDLRLEDLCRRHKRFAQPASLLLLDIDHFKDINDSHGHAAGDRVLRVIASHLRQSLRETDFIARYGGEEFAVLLEGSAGASALEVAEKIRARIEHLGFHMQQRPVPVTLCVGVADLRTGDTPESLFARADAALYGAKSAGRNRCVLAAP